MSDEIQASRAFWTEERLRVRIMEVLRRAWWEQNKHLKREQGIGSLTLWSLARPDERCPRRLPYHRMLATLEGMIERGAIKRRRIPDPESGFPYAHYLAEADRSPHFGLTHVAHTVIENGQEMHYDEHGFRTRRGRVVNLEEQRQTKKQAPKKVRKRA